MRTHKQIISDAGGTGKLAGLLSADINMVKQWMRNDSIPAWHWEDVVAADIATLEELAAAAKVRATTAAAARQDAA